MPRRAWRAALLPAATMVTVASEARKVAASTHSAAPIPAREASRAASAGPATRASWLAVSMEALAPSARSPGNRSCTRIARDASKNTDAHADTHASTSTIHTWPACSHASTPSTAKTANRTVSATRTTRVASSRSASGPAGIATTKYPAERAAAASAASSGLPVICSTSSGIASSARPSPMIEVTWPARNTRRTTVLSPGPEGSAGQPPPACHRRTIGPAVLVSSSHVQPCVWPSRVRAW